MHSSGYIVKSILGLIVILFGQKVSYCAPLWTNFHWNENDVTNTRSIDTDVIKQLNRHLMSVNTNSTNESTEEKDFFTKVSEFYSDKNNLAMYLVLPLLVVIYGGCSAIYCVAKCRQYLRRRKHKRLTENSEQTDDNDSQIDTNENQLPQDEIGAPNKNNTPDCKNSITSISDVNYNSGRTSTTPLPWQVPEKDEEYTDHSQPANASRQNTNSFIISPRPPSNISRNRSKLSNELRPETASSIERNVSSTPQSRRNGSHVSNETLRQDPDVIPTTEKRASSRISTSVSRQEDHVEIDVHKNIGRFSRSGQEEVVENRPNTRQKIISPGNDTAYSPPKHEPVSSNTTSKSNYQIEQLSSLSIAKQAAQLLRVDLQNRRGVSKKQKRLVFVAE